MLNIIDNDDFGWFKIQIDNKREIKLAQMVVVLFLMTIWEDDKKYAVLGNWWQCRNLL